MFRLHLWLTEDLFWPVHTCYLRTHLIYICFLCFPHLFCEDFSIKTRSNVYLVFTYNSVFQYMYLCLPITLCSNRCICIFGDLGNYGLQWAGFLISSFLCCVFCAPPRVSWNIWWCCWSNIRGTDCSQENIHAANHFLWTVDQGSYT